MAEAFLRARLPDRLKDKVRILSAGTLGIFGDMATLEAIQAMLEKKIDIRNHISQGVSEKLVEQSDIILVLAREHLDFINEHFPHALDRVFLLRKFGMASDEHKEESVADPIGLGIDYYRITRDLLENEINRILPQLVRLIDRSTVSTEE